MAGFFGLFGKKEEDEGPKDAYFLSADDSKTYGDIDYMRTSKTVRKTFVKTVGSPNVGEVFNTVSSESQVKRSGNDARRTGTENPGSFNTSTSSTSASSAPAQPSTPTPRNTSNDGLDMFRNMAKQVRGRK